MHRSIRKPSNIYASHIQKCFPLRPIYFLNKIEVYKALDGNRMPTDKWHLANRAYSARIASLFLKVIIYLNQNAKRTTPK